MNLHQKAAELPTMGVFTLPCKTQHMSTYGDVSLKVKSLDKVSLRSNTSNV